MAVLITGVTGSLGSSIALSLHSRGIEVVGTSRVPPSRWNREVRAAVAHPVVEGFEDVSRGQVALQEKIQALGPLDGFVHCAGHDYWNLIGRVEHAHLQHLFHVHVFVPLLLVGFLGKKGNMTDKGSIVLISSMASREQARGHSTYAAAKSSIEGFAKPAAAELSRRGIRLNVIAPGVVDSEMSSRWLLRLDVETRAKILGRYPLGFGLPSDVANLVTFLLRPESSWITGTTIELGGGS